MQDDSFEYTIFIECDPERVWKALTDGAASRQYWAGRRITSDWNSGAPVHLYIEDTDDFEVSGEVLAFEPPRRLSYTWRGGEDDAGEARVTFELHPMGGSVRLSLSHAPLASDDPARQGWSAILSSLKSYLETGRPLSATEMWRNRRAEAHGG